jgi:hypothetical protein
LGTSVCPCYGAVEYSGDGDTSNPKSGGGGGGGGGRLDDLVMFDGTAFLPNVW